MTDTHAPSGPAAPPVAEAPVVPAPRPGSAGEHRIQERRGTRQRADRFYDDQMSDHLLPSMVEFVGRMPMVFLATADVRGGCDSSVRSGPPGFVAVLDERRLALPDHRGPGTAASLRNIEENPHVGLLMVDFVDDLIGLHVNGRARLVADAVLRGAHPGLPGAPRAGHRGTPWVEVTVDEAYIHCRKHIPRLQAAEGDARSTADPDRGAPSDG